MTATVHPLSHWRAEWDALLGAAKDRELARQLGVSAYVVSKRRRKLGVKRYLTNRAGMKYGRWTILREAEGYSASTSPLYECRCECGRVAVVRLSNMTMGKSTGCFRCLVDSLTKYRVGGKYGSNTLLRVWTARAGGNRRADVRCDKCGYRRQITLAGPKRDSCLRCKPPLPRDQTGRHFSLDGETHNLSGWARKLGITREAMRLRMLRMGVRDALTRTRQQGGRRATA